MYLSYLEYFRKRGFPPRRDSRFYIGLHNDCLSVIFFWKINFVCLYTRAISSYNAPLLFSYSDASYVACGAFVVGTNEVSHRMWTACEAVKSSTWRELKAIQFALSAFKALVRGKCIKWHSDSQGAVRVVEIGSPSAELHSIALDIFIFFFLFLSNLQYHTYSPVGSQGT